MTSGCLYRDEIYSLQILLSRTQAGPGRTVKKEQEEISPNHVQRLNLISVHWYTVGLFIASPFLTHTAHIVTSKVVIVPLDSCSCPLLVGDLGKPKALSCPVFQTSQVADGCWCCMQNSIDHLHCDNTL